LVVVKGKPKKLPPQFPQKKKKKKRPGEKYRGRKNKKTRYGVWGAMVV